jgi:hypothetical protein
MFQVDLATLVLISYFYLTCLDLTIIIMVTVYFPLHLPVILPVTLSFIQYSISEFLMGSIKAEYAVDEALFE